jgi:hypothetical protein
MPMAARKKIKHPRGAIKRRAKTAAEKMRAFRARMRAKGFKLVQRWVVDTSRPEFIAEARRQSRLISGTPEDEDANRALAALAEDSALWS